MTTTTPEQRLAALGYYVLPPPPQPAANYQPCQLSGDVLFLSGHLPFQIDGVTLSHTGKLGKSQDILDDPVAIGYEAAKQVGLNIIATLQQELGVGNLCRVDQIVKIFGFVQSRDDFHEQHKVLNGCSDLMTEVFGPDCGSHARSAVGTNALPLDSMIEIEAIVRIKPLIPITDSL
jgi:enamine deaminase RidA (YjgF/YER057c/UK114 family)